MLQAIEDDDGQVYEYECTNCKVRSVPAFYGVHITFDIIFSMICTIFISEAWATGGRCKAVLHKLAMAASSIRWTGNVLPPQGLHM